MGESDRLVAEKSPGRADKCGGPMRKSGTSMNKTRTAGGKIELVTGNGMHSDSERSHVGRTMSATDGPTPPQGWRKSPLGLW